MRKKASIIVDLLFVAIVFLIIIVGVIIKKNKPVMEYEDYGCQILEKDVEISALYTDGQRVYVGTNKGLHIYDAGTKEMVDNIEDITMVYAAGMVSDDEGGLWIGHEKGLTHLFSDGRQELFSFPQIPKGRVNAVACRDGYVYAGTYNGGVRLKQTNGKWEVDQLMNKEWGLISDSVNMILPLDEGILIGSYLDTNGGLTYISDKGWTQCIDINGGLPHPYVTSAVSLGDGRILVGSGYMRDGGLALLELDADSIRVLNTYSKDEGMPGEKIRYLYVDDKSLWITTEYDGILINIKPENGDYLEGEGVYLTENNGLSDNEIKCIVGTSGYYWLGGKYGLTIVPERVAR